MNDLRDIWSDHGILIDTNNDEVPDETSLYIEGISENCIPIGLIDFMARVGLETTGTSLDFFDFSAKNKKRWVLSLETGKNDIVHCQLFDSEKKIQISGRTEEELSDFLRWFASSWPLSWSKRHGRSKAQNINIIDFDGSRFRTGTNSIDFSTWEKTEQNENNEIESFHPSFKSLTDLWTTSGFYQSGEVGLNDQSDVTFNFINRPGVETFQQACLLAARIGLYSTGIQFPLTKRMNDSEVIFSISKSQSATANASWNIKKSKSVEITVEGNEMSSAKALNYLAHAQPFEEGGSFGIWEKDVHRSGEESLPVLMNKTWTARSEKNEIIDLINKSSLQFKDQKSLDIKIFVSESFQVRTDLTRMVKDKFNFVDNLSVQVYSAYKPAYHWVEENVLSKLLAINEPIEKIVIKCKKECTDNGIELPIRWIQELYPIDQFLKNKLTIPLKNISLELEKNQKETYIFQAISVTGKVIFQDTLTVPVAEMAYINSDKKVYPTTGCLLITSEGRVLKREHIETDREKFWTYFMEKVLNKLPSLLPIDDAKRGRELPLFSYLTVDVQMSEEERRLGIGEERISSLESLHEDIYFNTLNFFANLGNKIAGSPIISPGGIRPYMHSRIGSEPEATIKLQGWGVPQQNEVITHQLSFNSLYAEPESARVMLNGKAMSIPSQKWRQPLKITLPELTAPCAKVWKAGESFEGRDIVAIDVSLQTEAKFVSAHKLSLYKPTIMIETGHHPNEVSSMPAIIQLINGLNKAILKKVNLSVIYCANPDGRALHQKLSSENRNWKLHAARFNAVGLEYYYQRFQKTLFDEANVVPRLFKRWLPDVSIDDHGIPSHEWVQSFAGYNSPPSFPVSYWIPISLIYGIVKDLSGADYKFYRQISKAVVNHIAEKIKKDDEINKLNSSIRETYYKYGSKWLPDVFPIQQTDNMIFYHWNTKVSNNSSQVIARYPEWCCVELISEAADETVDGRALTVCMRAHQLFDLAVIDTVSNSFVRKELKNSNGLISYFRRRPLQLKELVMDNNQKVGERLK